LNLAVYVLAPLIAMAIMAGVAVPIVAIALRGTAPRDRARILHAIADVFRAVWHAK